MPAIGRIGAHTGVCICPQAHVSEPVDVGLCMRIGVPVDEHRCRRPGSPPTPSTDENSPPHPWKDEQHDGHRPNLCVLSILPAGEPQAPKESKGSKESGHWKAFVEGQAEHYYGEASYQELSATDFTQPKLKDTAEAAFKPCTHPADQRLLLAHVLVLQEKLSGLQYLVPVKDGAVMGSKDTWVETSAFLESLLQAMPLARTEPSIVSDAPRPLLMLIDSRVPPKDQLHAVPAGFEPRALIPLDRWQFQAQGAATLVAPDETYSGDFLSDVLRLARGGEDDIPPRLDAGRADFEEKLDKKWPKKGMEKGSQKTAAKGASEQSTKARKEFSDKLLGRAQEHHGLLSFSELKWFLRYFSQSPNTPENPITESRAGGTFNDVPLFWMPDYVKKREDKESAVCNGFSEHETSSIAGAKTPIKALILEKLEKDKQRLDIDGDGELPTSLCPRKRYGRDYATDCNDQERDMSTYTMNKGNRIKSVEKFGDLKDNNCDGKIDEYAFTDEDIAGWDWKERREHYYAVLDWDAKEMRYASLSRCQGLSGLLGGVAWGYASYQLFTQILPYRSCAAAENGPFSTLCNAGQIDENITPTVLRTRSRQALGAIVAGGLGVGLTVTFGVERGHLDNRLKSSGSQGFNRKKQAENEKDRDRYWSWDPLCRPELTLVPQLRTLWKKSSSERSSN